MSPSKNTNPAVADFCRLVFLSAALTALPGAVVSSHASHGRYVPVQGEEQMPFDGSSWKRWDEDAERLWCQRLVRLLWAMTCIVWAAALTVLLAGRIAN